MDGASLCFLDFLLFLGVERRRWAKINLSVKQRSANFDRISIEFSPSRCWELHAALFLSDRAVHLFEIHWRPIYLRQVNR